MPSALLAQLPPRRCAYAWAGLAARSWRLLPSTQPQAYTQGRAAAFACLLPAGRASRWYASEAGGSARGAMGGSGGCAHVKRGFDNHLEGSSIERYSEVA